VEEEATKKDLTTEQMLALAAIALGPALLGGAMGGKQGALAGAAAGTGAGGKGLSAIADRQAETEKEEKAAKAKEQARQQRQEDELDLHQKKKELDKKDDTQAYTDAKGNKRQGSKGPDGKVIQSENDPILEPPTPKEVKPPELPIDTKATVTTLATKNANKISIRNSIEGYINAFKAAKTKDDQIRIGRQMLKVINSTEGADAIAAEEAQRLGTALETQVFNWKGPGPIIGRDLEGFARQVDSTVSSIDAGIQANQSHIDQLMGRAPAAAPKAPAVTESQPSYVRMQKDGESPMDVLESDVADAEKDGYRRVK
jgi:hypothetical protein